MNLLLTTLVIAVVSMSAVFPSGVRAATVTTAGDAQPIELEPPLALPLAATGAAAAVASVASTASSAGVAAADAVAVPVAPAVAPQLNNDLGEVWQEDDREVLIRNARRAKDNGGASGGAGAAGQAAGKGKGGKGGKKAQRQSAAKAAAAAAAAAKATAAPTVANEKAVEGSKIPPSKLSDLFCLPSCSPIWRV